MWNDNGCLLEAKWPGSTKGWGRNVGATSHLQPMVLINHVISVGGSAQQNMRNSESSWTAPMTNSTSNWGLGSQWEVFCLTPYTSKCETFWGCEHQRWFGCMTMSLWSSGYLGQGFKWKASLQPWTSGEKIWSLQRDQDWNIPLR